LQVFFSQFSFLFIAKKERYAMKMNLFARKHIEGLVADTRTTIASFVITLSLTFIMGGGGCESKKASPGWFHDWHGVQAEQGFQDGDPLHFLWIKESLQVVGTNCFEIHGLPAGQTILKFEQRVMDLPDEDTSIRVGLVYCGDHRAPVWRAEISRKKHNFLRLTLLDLETNEPDIVIWFRENKDGTVPDSSGRLAHEQIKHHSDEKKL
jgi:hypothetical protein